MRSSLKRLAALIKKETVQLWRDRRTLGLILVLPFVELFLLAYAVDLTVDHIPTAVADLSRDRQSQALLDALTVSGFFDVETYLADERQLIRAIDEGRVRAAVLIPPDFAAQVERGTAQVLILLDGSDSFTVQSGYSAALAITQAHGIELMVQKVGRLGAALKPPSSSAALPASAQAGAVSSLGSLPVNSVTRVLYNPNMDDMVFLLPAIAAFLLQTMAINLTALSVVRDRELGTIEQLLSTPARPIELMISKMLPNLAVTFIGLICITLIGGYWFNVPFHGNIWLFAWLALLFAVSGLGLGLLISTIAQNQKQAQMITTLVLLLSLLLTGFVYPRNAMPAVVQAIGNLIPLTYFIRITRGVYTKGVGLSYVWSDVVSLAIYAAVAMLGAAITFKKRLD